MSSSETKLVPLDVAPGINRDVTPYAAKYTYVSCDKIRFKEGKPQKLGGWVKEIVQQTLPNYPATFTGTPRAWHSWIGLDGTKYYATGTHKKLEILSDNKIYDITPIRASVSASNVINTSANSPFVRLSITAHGAQTSSYVEILNQSSSVGNVFLSGVYEIVSVPNPNTVIISVPTSATLTTVGGGGTKFNFLLDSGEADNGFGFGWSAGSWSTPGVSVSAGWSDPRGGGTVIELRQWSLDNWGEDLIANPKGGRIYTWHASAGLNKRATVISASPSVNDFILIAQPARHLMSFGCTNFAGTYDPLTVRWSDSEDFTDWTPSVSSEAGEFRLKGGNFNIGAEQSSREIVALTDNAAHKITYLGNDFIFGSDQIGSDCGLIARHAAVDVNGNIMWMSYNSFFSYNGTVRKIPCPIDKSIFNSSEPTSLNFTQKEKTFAGLNAEFNEVIWLYPSKNSQENDRYIIYNYLENLWYDGTIARTIWDDVGVSEKPYATAPDGTLYSHENGRDDDGSPMLSFIETGETDIEDGNAIMFIDKFIPDFEITDNRALQMSLLIRKYPGEDFTVKGPYTINNNTRFVNPRARGRRLKIRYESNDLGGYFEVGTPELGLKPDGGR